MFSLKRSSTRSHMKARSRYLYQFIGASLLIACQPMENLHPDVHGHRGFAGKYPENSIPGFLAAVEVGCDHLEMDIVLSGDGQILVSHEPWMKATLCRMPDGSPIDPAKERDLNLHRMSVGTIQRYDCGSMPDPRFPDRKLQPTYKPTLRQVVESADEHAVFSGMTSPSYNIEVKSDSAWYGVYQPLPEAYAQAVIMTIDSLGIASRCMIQSFDTTVLEAFHAERPDIPLALLVENTDGVDENLRRLTFKPTVYSPHYLLADKATLRKLREADIELVVWTVNEQKDIRRMLDLGVDGIISDHPDLVIEELEGRE